MAVRAKAAASGGLVPFGVENKTLALLFFHWVKMALRGVLSGTSPDFQKSRHILERSSSPKLQNSGTVSGAFSKIETTDRRSPGFYLSGD